jgi:hypothetical protein
VGKIIIRAMRPIAALMSVFTIFELK